MRYRRVRPKTAGIPRLIYFNLLQSPFIYQTQRRRSNLNTQGFALTSLPGSEAMWTRVLFEHFRGFRMPHKNLRGGSNHQFPLFNEALFSFPLLHQNEEPGFMAAFTLARKEQKSRNPALSLYSEIVRLEINITVPYRLATASSRLCRNIGGHSFPFSRLLSLWEQVYRYHRVKNFNRSIKQFRA